MIYEEWRYKTQISLAITTDFDDWQQTKWKSCALDFFVHPEYIHHRSHEKDVLNPDKHYDNDIALIRAATPVKDIGNGYSDGSLY